MRCPICKGKMELKEDVIKQDNIKFVCYKCKGCGEELMNSKQLKALAGKYHALRKAKDIIFARWGNSIAVRIPSEIAKELCISSGMQGLMIKENDCIKIMVLQG